MMPEDNNNCEPETSGGERTTDGRFNVGPAECGDRASPRRARKKVSVVTFVEGERKTSIYNWVGHTSSHYLDLCATSVSTFIFYDIDILLSLFLFRILNWTFTSILMS